VDVLTQINDKTNNTFVDEDQGLDDEEKQVIQEMRQKSTLVVIKRLDEDAEEPKAGINKTIGSPEPVVRTFPKQGRKGNKPSGLISIKSINSKLGGPQISLKFAPKFRETTIIRGDQSKESMDTGVSVGSPLSGMADYGSMDD